MDWLHGDYFAWWSITNGEGYAIGMITIIIILVVVVQTVAIILRVVPCRDTIKRVSELAHSANTFTNGNRLSRRSMTIGHLIFYTFLWHRNRSISLHVCGLIIIDNFAVQTQIIMSRTESISGMHFSTNEISSSSSTIDDSYRGEEEDLCLCVSMRTIFWLVVLCDCREQSAIWKWTTTNAVDY